MRGTTTPLGREARCAPPVHPPGLWHLTGIEPDQVPVGRLQLSPNPIDQPFADWMRGSSSTIAVNWLASAQGLTLLLD